MRELKDEAVMFQIKGQQLKCSGFSPWGRLTLEPISELRLEAQFQLTIYPVVRSRCSLDRLLMWLLLLQLKGKMKRKRRMCEEECVGNSKRKRHGSIGNITNMSSVTPGRVKSASGTLTRTNSLRMIR